MILNWHAELFRLRIHSIPPVLARCGVNNQIGGRTLASIFREAGCLEPASPSCAACLGGPADTYARMNEPLQCVSTTNRNFPGRMGHKVGLLFWHVVLTIYLGKKFFTYPL